MFNRAFWCTYWSQWSSQYEQKLQWHWNSKILTNINGVDIDKMFISGKFGFGKNVLSISWPAKTIRIVFLCVNQSSKNEWVCTNFWWSEKWWIWNMVLVPLLKIKKPWLKIVNIRNLNKAKLVSNWEQNMLYTKKWQILRRKGISILTDWKMSFLCVYVCVCVLQTRI